MPSDFRCKQIHIWKMGVSVRVYQIYWVSVRLEDDPSRNKYWQRKNPRPRPGVWRLTARLGSHPSSHVEKDSHLHSLFLAQWAVTGIHQRVKASHYSCGSVIYAEAIMEVCHLFHRYKEKKNKTKQSKETKTMRIRWQGWGLPCSSLTLLWGLPVWISNFEILESCLCLAAWLTPLGGVQSERLRLLPFSGRR